MARDQYEIQWKDYYQILEVDPRADADAIAAAYRKLAMTYHPDRNQSPDATQKFQEINEAKEVLSDPERRARYDQVYTGGPGSASGGWSEPESGSYYWENEQNNWQADGNSTWETGGWTTEEAEETWHYYEPESFYQEGPTRNRRAGFSLWRDRKSVV
jgi:DnaJ-class molecular chaperone